MSDDLNQDPKLDLDSITAGIGFNDGANNGFWRIQPRDDEGQWIEMGADVLFRIRTGDGSLVVATERGVYVGPAGRPGYARVMVPKDSESGLKAGVYEVESRNLQQFKALLPDADGGAKDGERLDKFGKPVRTLEDSKLPDLKAMLDTYQPITKEDERLARGELTEEERAAEADGRNKSPIADLPAGFESENPEEVKDLLRKSGVEPDDFDANLKKFEPRKTPLDLEAARQYDGSGRYDPNIKRENLQRAAQRKKLEKDLGRSLTSEELAALGLTQQNEEFGRKYENPLIILTPEDSKKFKDVAAKNHAIRKRIQAELNGATLDDKDAAADAKIREAYQDAFEGDAPSLDSLETESLALARELSRRTKQEGPIDIDPGNIILEDGEELVVLENRLGDGSQNKPARITVQKADGTTKVLTPAMSDRLEVVQGRRGTPVRPPAPEAKTPSTTPATPDQINDLIDLEAKGIDNPELAAEVEEILNTRGDVDGSRLDDLIARVRESQGGAAPEEPATSTDIGEGGDQLGDVSLVPTIPGLQPANFPPEDRMDDGSEFELPVLTTEQIDKAREMQLTPLLDADGTPAKYVDENNRVVDAEDPFSMMAALAKIYPNAKFTPDGALVLHRQKDKDGRIFELRANNSGKKAIVYSMRWTDPATGEYKEYQHKDDRHSIKALLRKDNGPQDLLDRLLGRTDNKGKNWGALKFGNTKYGPSDSLFKRLRWFMSGTGDRKKMEEIGDNAIRLAQGRATVFHKDGTVKNSEIPSLWDAFNEYFTSGATKEDRDVESRDNLYQTLYAVFGRIPLDEKSHARARAAIRSEFKRQFPTASAAETRAFGGILTSASERMRGIYREPDAQVRSIRYASKDRTRAIERGQTVEYTNNVGETSIVTVTDLIENINATPVNGSLYNYDDYVVIKDANGRQIKVNALKLKILRDQNTSLSAYKPNLQGEALRQRRIELGQWLPQADADASRPKRPYIGSTGIPGQDTVLSDPAPEPKLIDDFVTGEMLYNKEGKPLGIIKAVKPVTGRNGTAGLAFLYQKADGTEGQASYALGTEINPKKA